MPDDRLAMIYSGIADEEPPAVDPRRGPRGVRLRGRRAAGPVRRPAGRAEGGRRPAQGARPAPARPARPADPDRRRRPAPRASSRRPPAPSTSTGRCGSWATATTSPGCMAAADLVVLPSVYEGLPNVVLEAMRFRKPVVATAAPGTTEVVVDGETGLLVPVAKPPAPGPGDPRPGPRPRPRPPARRGGPGHASVARRSARPRRWSTGSPPSIDELARAKDLKARAEQAEPKPASP